MADRAGNDSLLEMFLYETSLHMEQLEQIILETGESGFSEEVVQEVFRIMHTVKGSAAMMSFEGISTLAHRMEDLFLALRGNPAEFGGASDVSDLVLACMDSINRATRRIRDSGAEDAENCRFMLEKVAQFLEEKAAGEAEPAVPVGRFQALLYFEPGCEMENIRAYSVVQELTPWVQSVAYEPADILDDHETAEIIREKGFLLHVTTTQSREELARHLGQTAFLHDLEVTVLSEEPADKKAAGLSVPDAAQEKAAPKGKGQKSAEASVEEYRFHPQSIISVGVSKLDDLMDLMGEAVIAEAMVSQSPDLPTSGLPHFSQNVARLKKIILDMQDAVMSLRLVPLAATFQKMHRIVRDMSKKLGKSVEIRLSGEEIEVDKNIIEHLSDPLIHLVRNCVDHGLESEEERRQSGKPPSGTVRLEAQNAGGDVIITVSDDGRGLNREKILEKGRQLGLLKRSAEELSDREIYNMIFLPGFSTKENVTEFSGRGVGMDVVTQNLSAIGGTVFADSVPGRGMTTTMKIPLTVAIVDGMNLAVGNAKFTIPIAAIRESFRPVKGEVFRDTDGEEMILVRGECLSVLRLHSRLQIQTDITECTDGIFIVVEQDGQRRCVFADAMLGRQQVVVKALPSYIRQKSRQDWLSGCTLLGDGSVSLILNVGGLLED